MDGYRLRSAHGDIIDPRQPLPIDSVEAQETSSVAPTFTYNGKAAAGAVSVSSLALKPIIEDLGSRVGSYWGDRQNMVYSAFADGNPAKETSWLTAVVETATSATVSIFDPDKNLEEMFESLTTTVKRFVVKVHDTSGGTLYGWIMGVAASSNLYTFDVMNNRVTETQSWVGTLGDFDNTALDKVEIFFYNSSLAFGTGTCFTEEVDCPKEYSKNRELQLKHAESLSNGQYFATASETVTYNVWSSTAGGSGGPASNVNVKQIGGVVVPVDDGAFTPGTTPVQPAGFFADETATDSVDEGDTGAARMTLDRKQITASEFLEDAAHASGDYGTHGLTVRDDSPVAKAGTDGDYQSLTSDSVGALWARLRGYDTGTDSNKAFEVNPLSDQYVSSSLADTTNVSAATHYYPSSTGGTMDGYKDQSLTGKFIDADGTLTLTLEVTNDEDTSGDWNGAYFYDNELNSTVNTKTVTNGTELFTLSVNNNNFRRYRWVVVASGATNTVILKERKKAL